MQILRRKIFGILLIDSHDKFGEAISAKTNPRAEMTMQRLLRGGGDLSSDGGLLLIKEFATRIGLLKLIKQLFKTNDHTTCRKHTDTENLMQMIYQIIAAYFEDDCTDELINDPVLTAILEKDTLAS